MISAAARALAVMLFSASLAWGQQAEPTTPDAAGQKPVAESQGGSEQEDVAAEAATVAGEEKPDPDAAPADYQASEQISDDLSVSYPVDI